MTLLEGKKKVYELLDEYSSGGVVTQDADLEARMADFFDIAQKRLSRISRIVRLARVERETGVTEYDLPADLQELSRVYRGGKVCRGAEIRGGKLIIPESDRESWELEYYAVPAAVSAATPDAYEFELGEDAAQAMPFFVAAQQLTADLVVDNTALLTLFRMMCEDLSARRADGALRIRNALYRG